ncbi:MAG: 6-carboxytetrahydropterin synthase [Candidatus Kapabacteria bacterium]|nr:6-carboxytetrahydropterin synthase [Ignavibacteriota bacterium]MCW5883547.1 6-carboxytetrahydropterin synthase [Candidatus Kapabacteria bacterium]
MLTKIGKEYKWEMSHRLPFHDGPCKNIHGHSYKMFVILEGEQDNNSMVLDYYDIDRFVKPLLDKLDHSFICDDKDDLMINFLRDNGFKYHVISYLTTSENLVTYMLDIAKPHFSQFDNLVSLTIRLYETEDAYAERTIQLKNR